jgi:DNA/RNA-binding protein KIN17
LDEQRERILIAEQIERAAAEVDTSSSSSSITPPVEGLKRDDGIEKVIFFLSAKPTTSAATPTTTMASAFKMNTLKPVKAAVDPPKRPNVLKAVGKAQKTEEKRPAAAMSAAGRLIIED